MFDISGVFFGLGPGVMERIIVGGIVRGAMLVGYLRWVFGGVCCCFSIASVLGCGDEPLWFLGFLFGITRAVRGVYCRVLFAGQGPGVE